VLSILLHFCFQFQLAPLHQGLPAGVRGRAVQVDPIKPTLKAPGIERLKLKYEELLSNFGFKFNLRRYSVCGIECQRDLYEAGLQSPRSRSE